MEKANIFHQMAQYDFTTPMNIITIFEEDSNDKISSSNLLKERLQDNHESSQDVEECRSVSNDITTTKYKNTLINDSISVQVIDVDGEQSHEHFSNTKQSKVCSSASTAGVAYLNTHGTEISSDNPFPGINDTAELCIVNNLLDTISEHLLVIIRHFYDYYYRNRNKNNPTDAEFFKRFNGVKYYFYNLSYTTIVSLILPQKQNDELINKLIDKTVINANKVFNWKCERKHVEPFLLQMIQWSKKKKDAMKPLELTHLNKDTILRKQLRQSPRPISIPNNSPLETYPTNGAINNYEVVSNTNRNMCIFTAGAPGKEISIHISPNTLKRHYKKQQTVMETPINRSTNTRNSPETEQIPTQLQNVVSVDYSQQNSCSANITIHHRPLPIQPLPKQPPPYYYNNTSTNVLTNNSYNTNQTHTNLSRAVQNIQTNQATYYYAPREQQYFTPMEMDGQTLPIISNVTSWNSMTSLTNGHCILCGKPTSLRCSKCYKFSYCSELCQELDSKTHKAACC